MKGERTMATSKKSKSPLQVGNAVLIRTVTMIQTGRIVEITPEEIVLEQAAWIADTGRFGDVVSKGTAGLKEVEPFAAPVSVGRGAIVDVTLWPGELPSVQK